jgi:N-formylglutamate deformylase
MQQVTYLEGSTPLVLDSPHSGAHYPADFGYVCDLAILRKAEDTHVEKLYSFAPSLGCAWVEAHFPRSYLDANRNTTEIDVNMLDGPWPHPVESHDPAVLSKLKLGKGLIWRVTDDGVALYNGRLSTQDVAQRIANCWHPYHAAVGRAIDAAHARHGYSIHLNCHSMPAIASSHATEFPGLAHADFVLGNRDDSTASAALVLYIKELLVLYGYSVAINHPYKGVELVRRYGQPAQHRHSVQVEINRKLYMHEDTLEMHAGFSSLQTHLKALVVQLLRTDPRKL